MATACVKPIQIPMAIGAMKTGVDRGASVLDATVRARLKDRGRQSIIDRILESQMVPVAPLEMPDTRRYPGQVLQLDAVAEASLLLAEAVSQSINRGELALTFGGDHAASVGTVAGAAAQCERLAVIWIDAHADMNWPEVSPSGRIHGMSLAASMGRGAPELTDILGKCPKVRSEDVYLIGIRLLDPGEEGWLREGDCHLVTMPDVDSVSLDAAIQHVIGRIRASGVDAVHLSFDVDALDPLVLSGTGTTERGGFTYREAHRILRLLRDSGLPVRSVDFVELNPDLDPTGASTDVAADLVALSLGEDVFRPALPAKGYVAR
ncbi:MAG: arginase [Thermomicrobiaceae bacterium]